MIDPYDHYYFVAINFNEVDNDLQFVGLEDVEFIKVYVFVVFTLTVRLMILCSLCSIRLFLLEQVTQHHA
jgi:hypothetical protein